VLRLPRKYGGPCKKPGVANPRNKTTSAIQFPVGLSLSLSLSLSFAVTSGTGKRIFPGKIIFHVSRDKCERSRTHATVYLQLNHIVARPDLLAARRADFNPRVSAAARLSRRERDDL